MSDPSARTEAAPEVLSDEAARRISELAFRWIRPWDFLLGFPARDQVGNIIGWLHYRSREDEAALRAHVVNMASATLGAILERWIPSETSRAGFIASIQGETPARTPALRGLCEAAERAHRIVDALYGPPKDFPAPDISWDQAREAWGELKAARLALEEALSADPAPAPPIEAPAASPPVDFSKIATELRKAGKEREARLVEFMSDKSEAPFRDVAKAVHDMPVSDEAIKSNRLRANRSLEAMGVPLRFRVASRRVYRELPAE